MVNGGIDVWWVAELLWVVEVVVKGNDVDGG